MSHKLNRSVFFSDLEKVHIIALTSETSQTPRDEKVSKCDHEIYSVQIRDVGRFLAKFNPWTNTFGNRLVRSHCVRVQSSVKLSTPIIIEPVHEISNNLVCATSKASDQPAHTRSLIRAFASRLSIL